MAIPLEICLSVFFSRDDLPKRSSMMPKVLLLSHTSKGASRSIQRIQLYKRASFINNCLHYDTSVWSSVFGRLPAAIRTTDSVVASSRELLGSENNLFSFTLQRLAGRRALQIRNDQVHSKRLDVHQNAIQSLNIRESLSLDSGRQTRIEVYHRPHDGR